MSRFDALRVKEIRKETPDCVSVSFDVPEDVKEKFSYKPGQYLTIKTTLAGEDIRRSYSICTAPYENELRVAVKKVEDGKFSTYANDTLKEGDVLDVMKPMGRFVAKTQNDGSSFLFFAAGSGITPVISIIKDVLHNQPNSEVTLVYGNKGYEHIIFREELIGLKNKFVDRLSIHHILSREVQGEKIYNGRIDANKCDVLFKVPLMDVEDYDEFFICGPEKMIMDVKDYLMNKGVDQNDIRFELFTSSAGQEKKEESKQERSEESKGPESHVKVIMDGMEHDFDLARDGKVILDAANEVGADLPFACKGGVCSTCRAKLEEGEVAMELNYSLEPEEIEQGFILTCQSHPISDNVVINFDEV